MGVDRDPGWRAVLAREIDAIGPMARDRCVAGPEPADECVSGDRLVDTEVLRGLIERSRPAAVDAGNPRDADPRVGLSRLSRQYCAALTCMALAGLVNGVGLDLSPARCVAVLRDDPPLRVAPAAGEPVRCAERRTPWPVDGPLLRSVAALRGYVWRNLYGHNLRRLFAAAIGIVDVPERLLWTNAAEWVAIVQESALEYLEPERARRYVEECRALLEAATLPGFGGAPNPLRGRLRWVPFDDGAPPDRVPTRRLCCLIYLHTDRHGRLCGNCPLLPLPDRAALIRERRGVGMARRGGPAELRCMEVGMRRRRLAERES